MRNLLATLLITCCLLAGAQSPQKINYQAVVRSSNGNPVANSTAVVMKFTIHDNTPLGTIVFTEQDTVTANQFGLVATQIGGHSNLANVNWGGGNKYLQVEVNVGNTSFADMGTSQMVSVPYALYAENIAGSSAVQSTKVHLNASQIQNMHLAAEQLLPAPGSGKFIQILSWYVVYNYGTVPYQQTTATEMLVSYGSGLTLNYIQGFTLSQNTYWPPVLKRDFLYFGRHSERVM